MTAFRRIVRIGCITLLVGLCLAGLTLSVLPSLIELWMLPQLAQQLGYADFDCRIDHMGLTETSAGPLRFGPGPAPALTIERIQLLYNPTSIAKGELDQIILSGLSIKGVIDKDGISLLGFEKKPAPANTLDLDPASKENLPTHSQLPALPFNTIIIRRSFLLVKTDNQEFRIPFSCTIEKTTIPESAITRLAGNLQFNPRGTPVSLAFSVNLTEKPFAHLELYGNRFQLLDFADIWSRIPDLKLRGQVALKAEADLNLSPLKVEKLQARIEWQQGELAYNNLHIYNSRSAAGVSPNTILTLSKNGISAPWQLQLNRLAFAAPFSPAITDLDISLRQNPDRIDLQGHWTTELTGYEPNSGLTLKPFAKKWALTADFDQQGSYKASLSSPTDDQKWQLDSDTLSVSGQSPDIRIALKGQKPGQRQLSWQFSLNQTVINNSGNILQCPTIKTVGQTEIKSANKGGSTLPVTKTKGNFTCQKLTLNQTDLGRIEASFQQQGEKFRFKGSYASKIIKELKLIVEGECGLKQTGGFLAGASLTIPACKPARPVILGKFLPAAGKGTFDGIFSATGKLAYDTDDSSKFHGEVTINLNDANFNDPEKNISCSNINCRLNFPELPSMFSAPDQKLTFAQLKAGNINCQNGTFSFQLERNQSLFIEKGRIGWCGGNVETQALRLSPNIDHYQSTLYCDRLKLTELLKQLGQIEAQGQGSVNGRIPIKLNRGKITFTDGFLYSTPNQPGNIKIKSGTALTAGIPTDSPQFAQLDLAREALKDYQYKWAKLKLNSQADELILNLQFDGKPNLALPFVYKKELGGFARITGEGPGSHFQGIRLDINLRLPLNHILQYKDLSNLVN